MENYWRKIREGDHGAFQIFFDIHYTDFCSYAHRYLQDPWLVEDVVSACFVKLWEQRERLNINGELRNYMLSMIRNAAISHLRLHQRHPSEILNDAQVQVADEEAGTWEETEAQIRALQRYVNELPAQRREILKLAVYQSMSYKEIADHLNISVNTVKTQMKRAYQFLRSHVSPTVLNFILFRKN